MNTNCYVVVELICKVTIKNIFLTILRQFYTFINEFWSYSFSHHLLFSFSLLQFPSNKNNVLVLMYKMVALQLVKEQRITVSGILSHKWDIHVTLPAFLLHSFLLLPTLTSVFMFSSKHWKESQFPVCCYGGKTLSWTTESLVSGETIPSSA